jgi:hypothetical protein
MYLYLSATSHCIVVFHIRFSDTLAQASVFDLVFIFTFVVLGSFDSRSVTYIPIFYI